MVSLRRWGTVVSAVWTHWATSSQLRTFQLPQHDAGTSLPGRAIGECLRGGPFVFDPLRAYQHGVVTSPNVAVIGSIGAGKSTVVKMMLTRGLAEGHAAVVLDPKSEYGALVRGHHGERVALGDGGWWNPFGCNDADNLNFLVALISTARGRNVTDIERAVIEERWLNSGATTSARPLASLWRSCEDQRDELAATLRRFVMGDLAGLVDGPGPPLEPSAPLLVLDMSSWWLSDSLAVAALVAWQMATVRLSKYEGRGYLVVDEAWALLQNEFATTWLQGAWKLARAHGIANIAVVHRLNDAQAAGDVGSANRSRAIGLLKDCSTYVLFQHAEGDVASLRETIGLSSTEERYVLSLPRGTALIRYGASRSVVRLTPTQEDFTFIDTDEAMR